MTIKEFKTAIIQDGNLMMQDKRDRLAYVMRAIDATVTILTSGQREVLIDWAYRKYEV